MESEFFGLREMTLSALLWHDLPGVSVSVGPDWHPGFSIYVHSTPGVNAMTEEFDSSQFSDARKQISSLQWEASAAFVVAMILLIAHGAGKQLLGWDFSGRDQGALEGIMALCVFTLVLLKCVKAVVAAMEEASKRSHDHMEELIHLLAERRS